MHLPPSAHEKWFVPDPGRYPGHWSFFWQPATLIACGVAVAFVVGWRLVALRLPRPELEVLNRLDRLVPWIPRLLAIHLGVSLLALAVHDQYLSPALSLTHVTAGSEIALTEGIVGVWLISGIKLRPAAILVILLGPLALVLAGPVAVLEAADLLGLALFLLILPGNPDGRVANRVDPMIVRRAMFALRICVGSSLIVLAFSEKLANPGLAHAFIKRYPPLDLFTTAGLHLGPNAFIRFAGAAELAFGLLIISGAAPQLVAIVAGIPFNATLFYFGRTELIGHLPVYGAMLALLVYGSSPRIAPFLWSPRRNKRLPWRRVERMARSGRFAEG
ncbi:MAG: hypothetical protein QOF16_62 [Actinomycetota bacterium]|nr:hypothetical protein [Actinomycetota bacterium]